MAIPSLRPRQRENDRSLAQGMVPWPGDSISGLEILSLIEGTVLQSRERFSAPGNSSPAQGTVLRARDGSSRRNCGNRGPFAAITFRLRRSHPVGGRSDGVAVIAAGSRWLSYASARAVIELAGLPGDREPPRSATR